MDLQALRWFQAVADGETVTETARLANITQPVVTRTLARLEQEVGATLLRRSGRRLHPTPAGRLFKEYADTVLARWDDGLRAISEFVEPDTGVVPLGFMHTFGTWLVPELISGYLHAHPGARFDLRQDADRALIDTLRSGAVNLAITTPSPDAPDHLRWRRLLTEPLLLAVPPRHRLARRQKVRLAEVTDEPFVVLRTGMGLRTLVEEICHEAGFAPRIAFEGDEVATLRGLVGAGLGVSLLPSQQPGLSRGAAPAEAARGEGAVPLIPVSSPVCARQIGLAWFDDHPLPPASRAFRDHVLREWPG
ncbi:LysR family transcriptional regulator [Streptomyces sp. NPDC002680]|uniref:LysR family transcriptional regulator n=1 Tax=Streptomyces sp. NPDC002680 TaxID=3364659 RepID=UPI0036D1158B